MPDSLPNRHSAERRNRNRNRNRNRSRSRSRKRTAVTLLLMLTTITGILAPAQPASAVVTTDAFILSADGVTNRDVDTATNIDAQVWAMESVGSVLLVGGKFRNVRDRSASSEQSQSYLAAFDANTGEFIPWFRPQVDGPVYDIVDAGNNQVLIAGEFTMVNGLSGTSGIARINLVDGSVDTSFTAAISGGSSKPVVRSLALSPSAIYVGGTFNRHTGPDGVRRATGSAIKIARSNGALDTAFTPIFTGGGVWGVAYNSTYQRVFAVGFYDSVNGLQTNGFGALDSTTGENAAGFTVSLPAEYLQTVAVLGPQIHDVETAGDRVIFTTKHHMYVVMNAETGSYINRARSAGTQRVELSQDGAFAYVGCHCDGGGYLRTVDLSTGALVGAFLQDVSGTAGVWAVEELSNGCVWTGGTLTYDRSRQRSVFNMLRLCNTATPTPVSGGITAPSTDTVSPTSPGTPQTRQFGASVDLSWTASSDDSGQLGYVIYRDGTDVGRSGTNQFDDLLVPPGDHEWAVVAIDPAGNLSVPSGLSTPVRIGQPVNIAPNFDFQASPGRNGTTADAMTDQNLASYWYPQEDANRHWFFQLDLGAQTGIDYVNIHESGVQGANLGLAAAAIKLSDNPFPAEPNEALASDYAFAALRVDRYYREVVRLDVATELRGIRLDSYDNYGQAIDEIEIFTTLPVATPATPAVDETDPVEPRWKRIRQISSQTMLEWGGASDDRGVASYEIWHNGSRLGTTSTTTFPIDAAQGPSRNFKVVAIDLAGNRSDGAGEVVVVDSVLSDNKPTSQSSTYGAAVSSRAVDGNTSGVWNRSSIAHTTREAQPWWEVDLGEVHTLSSVSIWNRTDCCSSRLNNVHVFVSSQPMDQAATVQQLIADAAVTHYDLGAGPLAAKTDVALSGEGRYVRIKINATEYLQLAEVQVSGDDGGGDGGGGVGVTDTERPSIPRKLTVSSVDGHAHLAWDASTDNVGVTGYAITRTNPDGSEVAIGNSPTTSFVDESTTAGQTYRYHLKAFDAAGNTSWRGGKVGVLIAPTGPVNNACTTTRDGTNVSVSWDFESPPSEIVIERSVNGGQFWWRGRVDYQAAPFVDADRAGTLAYRVTPKTGGIKGAPVLCTE